MRVLRFIKSPNSDGMFPCKGFPSRAKNETYDESK
jgi:hypothetical protein